MTRTREEAEAIAYEACNTWMVFKNVSDFWNDDDGLEHEFPPEAQAVWGLLVNPADPHDVITLTSDGYTLLDGHRLELDTYIWAIADLCDR
jgi:hypothetical protein